MFIEAHSIYYNIIVYYAIVHLYILYIGLYIHRQYYKNVLIQSKYIHIYIHMENYAYHNDRQTDIDR